MEQKKPDEGRIEKGEVALEDIIGANIILPTTPKEEIKNILNNLLYFLEEVAPTLNIDENQLDFFDLPSHLNAMSKNMLSLIGKQLDLILHHPKFSRLEGQWKGLEYLITNSEIGTNLIVKVLHVTKNQLIKDLMRNDWDQSKLFKLVYEFEFGTYGGVPFTYMIYDEYVSSSNQDIELMSRMSSVFAAAHCPCVSAVHQIMFNTDDYRKINQTRDISKIVTSKIAWQAFRKSEDSRYFALTLPRVLSRIPYSVDNNPADDIEYNEVVDGENSEHFTWMNAAYVLGVRINSSFSETGWLAAIRGVEGGGLATDLPVYMYVRSHGDISIKCPTETPITDRREKELSDRGFVCICYCKGTNYAVFFSVQTCQLAEDYELENAQANAKLSTRLEYVLIAARFAQYIKVILRNKIGSFATQDQIEKDLQNWLSNYVLLNEGASKEAKARMPLKAAKVKCVPVPGSPGSYQVVIYLSPHYHLDEIEVSLRLVAKIPALK